MRVTPKTNESTASVVRRFNTIVKRSGMVSSLKAKRFRVRPVTKRTEQKRAIMREALRGLRRRLVRLGKFDDDTFREEKQKTKRSVK